MIAPKCRKVLPRFMALTCLIVLFAAMFGRPASAHDARPLSINIAEQSAGIYLSRLRVPPTVESGNLPTVIWPDNCRVLRQEMRNEPPAPNETTLLGCKDGLAGRHVSVRYPIYNPSLSTLFRLSEVGGRTLTQVLTPDQSDWLVPTDPGSRDVAAGYLKLGIEHIWRGVDHLLFVFGLLVLARTTRRVLLAITGFTIAHSLTLSLSALGLVHVPVAPVEAAIALSILFLAREIARPNPDGLAGRFPIMVSSAFGLLHGFGFAAALREVGLPAKELALGLLCFNIGVEIGQVVFIAGVAAVFLSARKLVQLGGLAVMPLQSRLHVLAGCVLGAPAAFWLFQRVEAFL